MEVNVSLHIKHLADACKINSSDTASQYLKCLTSCIMLVVKRLCKVSITQQIKPE